MEKAYYSADDLERALLTFEKRYGMGSAEFYERHVADDLGDDIPGSHRFAWASFHRNVLRMRGDDFASHVERSLQLV